MMSPAVTKSRGSASAFRWCCVAALFVASVAGKAAAQSDKAVGQQHDMIGAAGTKDSVKVPQDPAMQWYPEVGLGMFIHWGISSVDGKHDLSWGMMANCLWHDKSESRRLRPRRISNLPIGSIRNRTIRRNGFGPPRTPVSAMPCSRRGTTTATPCGRASIGDFSTRTHMGGRDLVRPYVEACRKVGLKVGFYYSPPDWYYNRDYRSFARQQGSPNRRTLGLKHEPVKLPKKPPGFETSTWTTSTAKSPN